MSARKAAAGDGPYPLPERWRWVKLGEVADVVSGGTPRKGVNEFWDGDVQWATPADLAKLDGATISNTPRKITEEGLRGSSAVLLPAGSVLLSSRAPIGYVAINEVPMATNQGFKSLVPGPALEARYLYHWLLSSRQLLQSRGNGATFKELSKKTVESLIFPLAPLPEQRRIADVLDMANGVIAVSRRREELFRGLRLSVFREMFPEDDVSHIPLGNICEFGSGSTPSKKETRYWNGSIPWFSAKDLKSTDLYDSKDHISQEALDESSIKLRPAGSVAMVVRGMILDHTFPVSVLRVDSTTNQDLKVIEPTEGVNIDFLASALKSRSGWILDRALTSAHGTKRLEMNLLKSIPIPDVSLEKQEMFADRVNWLRQISGYSRCLDLSLSYLLSALQSRAFRGDL